MTDIIDQQDVIELIKAVLGKAEFNRPEWD
jgi:hypothetical protein